MISNHLLQIRPSNRGNLSLHRDPVDFRLGIDSSEEQANLRRLVAFSNELTAQEFGLPDTRASRVLRIYVLPGREAARTYNQ
jgi:hypothetical protein